MVSEGASGDVAGDVPDDPTCRHTTVPVSSHAAMSGSQCPLCNDGSPSMCGASENVIAVNPRSAFRRTSSAPTSGSRRYGICSGIMRPGAYPTQSSSTQSFHARTLAEREVGIVGELLEPLTGEAGEERREAQRRVHAVEVHVGDAGGDVPRAAPHLVEAGRLEAVLAHRTADDRVEADVGQLLALVDPRLAAVVAFDDARRAIGVLRRACGPRTRSAARRCGRRPRSP